MNPLTQKAIAALKERWPADIPAMWPGPGQRFRAPADRPWARIGSGTHPPTLVISLWTPTACEKRQTQEARDAVTALVAELNDAPTDFTLDLRAGGDFLRDPGGACDTLNFAIRRRATNVRPGDLVRWLMDADTEPVNGEIILVAGGRATVAWAPNPHGLEVSCRIPVGTMAGPDWTVKRPEPRPRKRPGKAA